MIKKSSQQLLNWMIRWVKIKFFLILLLILLLSYFIKYPEFVTVSKVVTSQNPLEKLQARLQSKIEKILIADQQMVMVKKMMF